ncbi:MAG TPA: hypothetical protein PLJ27_18360, partial [Polyangiaceae bacterium]|nr:hypothetical protein [Polyangiaceae bacterium]
QSENIGKRRESVRAPNVKAAFASHRFRKPAAPRDPAGACFRLCFPRESARRFAVIAASRLDFAIWRATSERDAFDLKSFEVRARPLAPIEGLRPGMTIRWYPE